MKQAVDDGPRAMIGPPGGGFDRAALLRHAGRHRAALRWTSTFDRGSLLRHARRRADARGALLVALAERQRGDSSFAARADALRRWHGAHRNAPHPFDPRDDGRHAPTELQAVRALVNHAQAGSGPLGALLRGFGIAVAREAAVTLKRVTAEQRVGAAGSKSTSRERIDLILVADVDGHEHVVICEAKFGSKSLHNRLAVYRAHARRNFPDCEGRTVHYRYLDFKSRTSLARKLRRNSDWRLTTWSLLLGRIERALADASINRPDLIAQRSDLWKKC